MLPENEQAHAAPKYTFLAWLRQNHEHVFTGLFVWSFLSARPVSHVALIAFFSLALALGLLFGGVRLLRIS